MTTRYADDQSPISQNSFASAEEYVEQRGIQGTAVAAKASLYEDPRKRDLLFAVQAMSLREGGLRRFAKELLEMFPERVGTETMHKLRLRRGQKCSEEVANSIKRDLGQHWAGWRAPDDETPPQPGPDVEVLEFFEQCEWKVESELPKFLVSLCVNPTWQITFAGETRAMEQEEKRFAGNKDESLVDHGFMRAEVDYFQDLVGAIPEYMSRHASSVWQSFAATSISTEVVSAINYGMKTKRMVLIQGGSGYGKSESAKTFAEAHPGLVRYVGLKAMTNKTVFFRALARVFGLPYAHGLSTTKIQSRVEDFIQSSGLTLIIDEAQYLWPQGQRIYRDPELINWINTACCNEGVSVILIATKEFSRKRTQVEKQTGWNNEQFRRRNSRQVNLPDKPSIEDLTIVVKKLLPMAKPGLMQTVVGYAMQGGFFTMIKDLALDARFIADEDNRKVVTQDDVAKALKEYRVPSDELQPRYTSEISAQRPGIKSKTTPIGRAVTLESSEESAPETNRLASADLTNA